MSRKSMWIGVIAVLVMTATMALTFASIGPGTNHVIGDIEQDPPGDEPCNCPAIYEPVVCKAPDGTRHHFSSFCVAHCSGYTKCERERPPSENCNLQNDVPPSKAHQDEFDRYPLRVIHDGQALSSLCPVSANILTLPAE